MHRGEARYQHFIMDYIKEKYLSNTESQRFNNYLSKMCEQVAQK